MFCSVSRAKYLKIGVLRLCLSAWVYWLVREFIRDDLSVNEEVYVPSRVYDKRTTGRELVPLSL
ncbi:hypothetical protein Hdeb2414_s0002g00048991 [Helianthus debilis subsp. tardiflorus]